MGAFSLNPLMDLAMVSVRVRTAERRQRRLGPRSAAIMSRISRGRRIKLPNFNLAAKAMAEGPWQLAIIGGAEQSLHGCLAVAALYNLDSLPSSGVFAM
jgi:hypothetical protein